MLNIKSYTAVLVALSLALTVSSCSDEETLDEITTSTDSQLTSTSSSLQSSTSPWDFDESYSTNDAMQVDNDGNGAHNWDEDDYENDPNDNGFDVRDYIFVSGGRLILQCPNGDDKRRAEYRDQTNIDLDRRNRMDLTFDKEGEIRLQRTNAPTGSSTTTASERIPFRQNDRYRIRMDSPNNSREIKVRIDNLDTGEEARNTFSFDSDWNDLDGSFYWKHGAYMPDGGSTNTQQRVETISFATNRSDI